MSEVAKTADKDVITKEETMFHMDKEGKAIPEKYEILIYDRDLDLELNQEAMLLMQCLKKRKALHSIIQKGVTEFNSKIAIAKKKFEAEKDEKEKSKLKRELDLLENTEAIENIKTMTNNNMTDETIKESRELIESLRKEKEKQIETKYAEVIPCLIAESYNALEKHKTIEGKDIDDWIADLIVNKCINPKYTLEEAKRLKPNYREALREAIAKVSNYQTINYRDLMIQQQLEQDKPLTLKKD